MTLDTSKWNKVTFGDIAKCLTIATKHPLSEALDRYVGLEHIEPGNIHIKSWGNVVDGTTFTRVFRKGQVLFGKRRAYQKKAALAEFDGICSGDILVCEAVEGAVLPELLPFIVRSDRFFEYAIKTSAASLSPRTKFKDLAKFSLSLPKLDKQKPIADLLWSIDETEEKYTELTRQYAIWLEVYSADMLRTNNVNLMATADKIRNSNGWQLKTVKEIAPLQRGFDLPSAQLKHGKWPVAYSNGICNFHSEYKVKGPGVFTGRSGTIGNIFYIEENYWPHNTALWVTDFKGNHPKFIYYLFKKLQFEKKQAGTGVPTLNRNYIHEIKALIPTYAEQVNIAERLDNLYEKFNEVNDLVKIINNIKKTLTNQMFG